MERVRVIVRKKKKKRKRYRDRERMIEKARRSSSRVSKE